MHAISTIFPNAQRHGCRFHLGQSLWRRIQTLGMPEDHRQELGYFEVVGVVFFRLSLLLSDEVGTAFANEIMTCIPFRLTIAASGSLLITSLITTLTPSVILHLT